MKSRNFEVALFSIVAGLFLTPALIHAQVVGDDFKQSVSGGFVYAVPVGLSQLNAAPGFSANYAYRLRPWLAVEGGLEQAVHPGGTFVIYGPLGVIRTPSNDQFYLIPFGLRASFSPNGGRTRIGAGFGGAFYSDRPSSAAITSDYFTTQSGFGPQVSASFDTALSNSGRFRLGVVARFYYLKSGEVFLRTFTVGPTFTYSFH